MVQKIIQLENELNRRIANLEKMENSLNKPLAPADLQNILQVTISSLATTQKSLLAIIELLKSK